MPEALHGAMALLIAVAGWYYMFHSRAAQRLDGVEMEHLNRRRIRLRRFGGGMMLLLAFCFYVAAKIDESASPRPWMLLWFAVAALLLAIVVLALIDLRLTWRLKAGRKDVDPS